MNMRRISYANAYTLSAYDIAVKQSDDVKPMWYKVVNDIEGVLVDNRNEDGFEYIDAPTIYDTISTLEDVFNVTVTTNVNCVHRDENGYVTILYTPMLIDNGVETKLRSREFDLVEDALEDGIVGAIEVVTLP